MINSKKIHFIGLSKPPSDERIAELLKLPVTAVKTIATNGTTATAIKTINENPKSA